jgi:hypothetical protein
MSSFPGSPRLLKGAIIGVDPLNPLASVIIFQYNLGQTHAHADRHRRLGALPRKTRLCV